MGRITRALASVLIILILCTTATAVVIETVPVGDLGNAHDPFSGNRYGGVDYAYRIGKYEVTNAQYAEFLNAKAASDPLLLWDSGMQSRKEGGIKRDGANGSYTYELKPNMADKPVNYVSWYAAIRFTNWLHNGQGAGDTETGAYTILGGTVDPANGMSITRNPGATWFLPNEDEWYKAAYYQPVSQGGDADGYWRFATGTNTIPTAATIDEFGSINNPGPNVVNYQHDIILGNPSTVGSAGALSASFYGTFDQSGNVEEWTEGTFRDMYRILRGGSWFGADGSISSQGGSSPLPIVESQFFGFRVATVPEPATYVSALLGLITLCAVRYRRNQSVKWYRL